MQTIRSVLNTYYTEFSKYPSSLKGLIDEKFIGPEVLNDGWNNPYIYKTQSDNANNSGQKYSLTSSGKDGIPGNNDDLKIASE